MTNEKLPSRFVLQAADILAETTSGLSGGQIRTYCEAYAIDFGVDLSETSSEYGGMVPYASNKRTTLYRYLSVFNGQQQFAIIKELSELPLFENNQKAKELRKNLLERYSSFSVTPTFDRNIELTGWERVDRSIKEMNNRLKVADTEEKYQAIGMLGRETLISIAQQVFSKSKHHSTDGTDISPTDTKRMFDAYIYYELKDESEKIIKHVKSAVDMTNQLTHDRKATKRAAGICVITVSCLANLMKYLKETEQ